mmetsp:Transcript_27593/g.50570  ORF Transcript_27593/g.50570 Transcript_27593/m.50570 type:complete len:233 (-) Transcript_27593:60-758(-)
MARDGQWPPCDSCYSDLCLGWAVTGGQCSFASGTSRSSTFRPESVRGRRLHRGSLCRCAPWSHARDVRSAGAGAPRWLSSWHCRYWQRGDVWRPRGSRPRGSGAYRQKAERGLGCLRHVGRGACLADDRVGRGGPGSTILRTREGFMDGCRVSLAPSERRVWRGTMPAMRHRPGRGHAGADDTAWKALRNTASLGIAQPLARIASSRPACAFVSRDRHNTDGGLQAQQKMER